MNTKNLVLTAVFANSEINLPERLSKAGKSGFDREPVSVDARGVEAADVGTPLDAAPERMLSVGELMDARSPGPAHGLDEDEQGDGTAAEHPAV